MTTLSLDVTLHIVARPRAQLDGRMITGGHQACNPSIHTTPICIMILNHL